MNRRNGFTLVELVVVIMILGILAGIAAPRMLNTAGSATDNGLRQTLAVIRDAIELYAAAPGNGGQLPPCTATGADFRAALEPYLRMDFPASPVGTKDFDVTPSTTDPLVADGATGWMYNTNTGEFICNEPSATASIAGTNYDDL